MFCMNVNETNLLFSQDSTNLGRERHIGTDQKLKSLLSTARDKNYGD